MSTGTWWAKQGPAVAPILVRSLQRWQDGSCSCASSPNDTCQETLAEARSCPSARITQPGGGEPGRAAVSTPMEEAIIWSPMTSHAEAEAVCDLEDHNKLKPTPPHKDDLTTQQAENVPCSANLACSYKVT